MKLTCFMPGKQKNKKTIVLVSMVIFPPIHFGVQKMIHYLTCVLLYTLGIHTEC